MALEESEHAPRPASRAGADAGENRLVRIDNRLVRIHVRAA